MVKVIVMRVAGTNCDEETVQGFYLAGADVDLVHLTELKRGDALLEDYQILAIPGGFSYGDDVSAGILWANQMRYQVHSQLKRFIDEGKPVLGVCNGFQVLVRAGLLPAFEEPLKKQEATLAFNDCGIFQDRWIHLKNENRGKCIFTKGIQQQITLPIAHAEGKFVADDRALAKLEENDQIVFKYVDASGNYSGFPWNPNGSVRNIAGICNPHGNVFGLMPHPERYVSRYMHPLWTRQNVPEEGDGLAIFRNAVEYAKKF
jgi:phosphoribosylformylglycinamidine synthase I